MSAPEPEANVIARVIAATELTAPPTGFASPHRLAWVERADGSRLLVMVDGVTPTEGETGLLSKDGEGRTHWVAVPRTEAPRG